MFRFNTHPNTAAEELRTNYRKVCHLPWLPFGKGVPLHAGTGDAPLKWALRQRNLQICAFKGFSAKQKPDTAHLCTCESFCTYRCRDVHDYLNTSMTTKRQLIPKCFSLWNLLHYFIILSSVSVRKREACPPLKISWSVLTVVNNYLLRRMFGFLHVNACHVTLMVDTPEGLPSMNCDGLYWKKKPWLKGGTGSVTIIEAG